MDKNKSLGSKVKLLVVMVVMVALVQYGCGGDNKSSSVANEYQGFYTSTSGDVETAAAILDDGSVYEVTTQGSDVSVIRGTATGGNGSLSLTDGLLYRFDGKAATGVQISATYRTKQSLQGTVTPTGGATSSFSLNYDNHYDNAADVSTLVKSYAGTMRTQQGREITGVSIQADGTVGVAMSVCKALGKVTPRSKGNVYNVALTFDNISNCPLSGISVDGALIRDDDGQVIIFATSKDRVTPLLFAGNPA